MKLAHSGIICALLLAVRAGAAEDLTGRWVGPASTADNGLEMVVSLQQASDGALNGRIQSRRSTETILSGKFDGASLAMETERRGRNNATQKVKYTGVLEGGTLKLILPAFRRDSTQVVELKRVSTEPPGPLPPAPARVSLPMPEPVPSNGLARTPPMGWNSWNKFRNQTTNNKFPDMKALAAYVHSKGLKLGIYSSPGPKTCAGYEGSYQHEEQDARTFAQWGIDYLKYDWCTPPQVYDNSQATQAGGPRTTSATPGSR